MNKRFQEILGLVQAGQLTTALKKCETAIKKKPGDINLLLLAASIHAQNAHFEKVVDYCLHVLNKSPKNPSALYNLSIAYLFLEDYEMAIKYSHGLVKQDKKNAKAYANLGLAYWHTGDLAKAKDNALIAEKLDTNIATNQNNLGLIYKSLNDTEKAITHFKLAIKFDAQLAEAYFNCGITLIDSGNDQGNDYIEKALLIKPDYPEAYNYKGLLHLENSQMSLAINNFKKAITYKPDYTEAYCNLGNALMEEKQYKQAETMYRKAIEYDPAYASAYNNLGNTLMELDDYRLHYTEAEQCYLKAIELAPELYDAYKHLALTYQGEGKNEHALKYFKLYDEHVPDEETVIASMASIHEHRGSYDEGMTLLQPYLQQENSSAEVHLAHAKLARHFKQENEAINALTKIDDSITQNKLQMEKYYLLGKLSETKSDTEATFNYYKKANSLDDEKFDLVQEENKFNNIVSYFTKDKIESLQRSGNGSKLPLFIVGMPRSGTTLAEQVLASHPDVFGAGELEDIHLLTKRIGTELKPTNSYPECLDNMSHDFAKQLATDHIKTLQCKSPNSKYIVDKMPHNFIGLGVINLLFPKATVIHCTRSSIDTCLSIYFQHFNKHHSYSNSLEMLGKYYNLYANMMEHWKHTLDINIIELEYEKVITDTETEMRRLLKNCNITWDPACLKFYENKRTVMTPSYDQVRRPIYSSSVAKWKKYEHLLGDLINSLGDRAC